ncbi:unnamed protein product [Closterium sp. NIES-54]
MSSCAGSFVRLTCSPSWSSRGGGGSSACQLNGGATRQRRLPPPDGDEGGMAPSDGVKHVRGFNGALQFVEGCGTVALQGEAGKRVLIPDVLYIPGVHANLLSAGQLKESGVQLKGDGDEMLLVVATGGGAWSSTLHRTSPLHRPLPLLNVVVVDRGSGSADDRLGDEVDP